MEGVRLGSVLPCRCPSDGLYYPAVIKSIHNAADSVSKIDVLFDSQETKQHGTCSLSLEDVVFDSKPLLNLKVGQIVYWHDTSNSETLKGKVISLGGDGPFNPNEWYTIAQDNKRGRSNRICLRAEQIFLLPSVSRKRGKNSLGSNGIHRLKQGAQLSVPYGRRRHCANAAINNVVERRSFSHYPNDRGMLNSCCLRNNVSSLSVSPVRVYKDDQLHEDHDKDESMCVEDGEQFSPVDEGIDLVDGDLFPFEDMPTNGKSLSRRLFRCKMPSCGVTKSSTSAIQQHLTDYHNVEHCETYYDEIEVDFKCDSEALSLHREKADSEHDIPHRRKLCSTNRKLSNNSFEMESIQSEVNGGMDSKRSRTINDATHGDAGVRRSSRLTNHSQ